MVGNGLLRIPKGVEKRSRVSNPSNTKRTAGTPTKQRETRKLANNRLAASSEDTEVKKVFALYSSSFH